jgi:hypothetical protein
VRHRRIQRRGAGARAGTRESDALPVANGRIELARTTAFAAGPALGGALVGWIGGGLAFAVAALLSASAVILLAGINEPNASSVRRVIRSSKYAKAPRSSCVIRCCGRSF